METSLVEPEDLRRRQFLRLLLVSAFLHGLVVSVLIAVPLTPSRRSLPAVVSVDLVSLPGAPAPPPAPAPAPKAAPKPLPKPEPQPEAVPAPKPKPKKTLLPAKPRQDPEQAKPKKPETVEYEDVLAQLRAERGEETPAPAPTVAPAPTPAPSAGGIGRLDPERARWERAVRAHLSRNWVLAPGLRAQPLVAEVEVRLDARGNVIGDPEIVRKSGNPWFDDSVVRAIEKASPLPAPPQAGLEIIIFDPEDFF